MPKIPKKYKVDSGSLTKKINESVHDPAKFQRMSQVEKNQILAAIQGSPDYQRLYATLNPSDKQYVDRNIGSPKPRKGGVTRGEEPYYENIPSLTPEQSTAAYSLLGAAVPEAFLGKDATPEQIEQARSQGVPGLLRELGKPSQLENQLSSMFGHLQNPILQGIMNPYLSQPSPQVLFPSQLGQQSTQGLESLLSQLAVPAVQYGIENAPAAYDYLQQNIPGAYQYAKDLGQQAYESTPGHFARGAFAGITDPFGSLQETGQAFGNIGKEKLQSLMNALGSYIPRRGQQPQNQG